MSDPFGFGFSWGTGGDAPADYTAYPIFMPLVDPFGYIARAGTLTGAVAGPLWSGSFWFKKGTNGVNQRMLNSKNARWRVLHNSNNFLEFNAQDATNVLLVDTFVATAITDFKWHHVAWSINTGGAGPVVYLDDAAATLTTGTFTSGNIDYLQDESYIGAHDIPPVQAQVFANGQLADIQMWSTVAPDLSQESIRRLFITSDGRPANPMAAETVLGRPLLRFLGPASRWHVNEGTGGAFAPQGPGVLNGTSPVKVGSG